MASATVRISWRSTSVAELMVAWTSSPQRARSTSARGSRGPGLVQHAQPMAAEVGVDRLVRPVKLHVVLADVVAVLRKVRARSFFLPMFLVSKK